MSNHLLLVIVFASLTIVGFTFFVKSQGLLTHSNARKRHSIWLFFVLFWITVLSTTLAIVPQTPQSFKKTLLICGIAAFLSTFIYVVRTYRDEIPTASILYVPLYEKAWFFRAIVPSTLKTGTTSRMELGLTEKLIDIRMMIDTDKKIEDALKDSVVLRMAGYREEALLNSGVLRENRSVVIRTTAPAFHPIPEIRTSIDDLIRSPVTILLLPVEDGEHIASVDIFDALGNRCGGFQLPLVVREKSRLLSQRAKRAVKISAAKLGMAAGIKLIIDLLLSVFGLKPLAK
jgi:hypothetical protein